AAQANGTIKPGSRLGEFRQGSEVTALISAMSNGGVVTTIAQYGYRLSLPGTDLSMPITMMHTPDGRSQLIIGPTAHRKLDNYVGALPPQDPNYREQQEKQFMEVLSIVANLRSRQVILFSDSNIEDHPLIIPGFGPVTIKPRTHSSVELSGVAQSQ